MENRLSTIETKNPDAMLYNKKIIGLQKFQIENLLRQNDITIMQVEDYMSFCTIFCEEIWSTFEFKYDRLCSIDFSVLVDKNDKLIWP